MGSGAGRAVAGAYHLQPSPGNTGPWGSGVVQEQGAIPTDWVESQPCLDRALAPAPDVGSGKGSWKDALVDRRLSGGGGVLAASAGKNLQSRAGGERGPQVQSRGSRRAKAKEIMQGQLVTAHSSHWNLTTPPRPLELHMALPHPIQTKPGIH